MSKINKNLAKHSIFAGANAASLANFAVRQTGQRPMIDWASLPKLMALRGTAEIFGVHPNTLREWDRSGQLRAVRLGTRRDRRYDKNTVIRLYKKIHPDQPALVPTRVLKKPWPALSAAALGLLLIVGLSNTRSAMAAFSSANQVSIVEPATCAGWTNGSQAKQINLSASARVSAYTQKNSAEYNSARLLVKSLTSRAVTTGPVEGFDPTLVCQRFTYVPADGASIQAATLRLSLAAVTARNSTDSLVVEYSFDGQSWTMLKHVALSGQELGLVDLAWPGELAVGDVSKIRLRFTIEAAEPLMARKIWLDGAALRLTSKTANQFSSVSPSNAQAQKELDRLTSFSRDTFQAGEQPAVTVPKSRQNNFLFFTAGQKQWRLVSVKIKDVNGNVFDASYHARDRAKGTDVDTTITLDMSKRHPGKYSIVVTEVAPDGSSETVTKDFLWGVVALNYGQAVPQPGSQESVSLGVLDDQGHTICDATLKLAITDPRGKSQVFTTKNRTVKTDPTCVDRGVTNNPDYSVNFTPQLAGAYHLRLEADTAAGKRVLEDNLIVDTTAVFEVNRTQSATRIYPPAKYPVRIAVTPKRDFIGEVQEHVPADFVISDVAPDGNIRPDPENKNQQILDWFVEWKKGQTYFLSYTYDAPDISPALFLTGPLKIGGSFTEAPLYLEPRQWQIASDALVKKTKDDINFTPLPEALGDWDVTQPALITTAKQIYNADEQVAVKLWTKGFSLDSKPGQPITVKQIDVAAPGGPSAGFDEADDLLTQNNLERTVVYLVPNKHLRPGTYIVTATLSDKTTITKSFEWGTLQVVPETSNHARLQTINFLLADTNAAGQPNCDSPMQLEVTPPSGKPITFSLADQTIDPPANCNPNALIGSDRFSAQYLPEHPGIYTYKLSRTTNGQIQFVTGSVTVVDRPEATGKVKKDIEEAVHIKKHDYNTGEQPKIEVNTASGSGLSKTTRQINAVKLIDPGQKESVIDPTITDQTQGSNVTSTITINPTTLRRPGKYHVVMSITESGAVHDVTQDFTWGVLAINVRRSFEPTNTDIQLGIAVLNDLGRTLCNAGLTLTITDPKGQSHDLTYAGGTIKKNPECRDKNITNDFDYYAPFHTGISGTYKLHLVADTDNGQRAIDDSFEVRDQVDFDVERTVFSMRIFPSAPYAQSFSIMVNKDYVGPVTETVPASFGIRDITDGGTVAPLSDERQQITWNVDWKVGEHHALGYSIDFPKISPEYYVLGPLIIGSFREARQWQVASDATCTASVTGNWAAGATWGGTCGSNSWPGAAASGDVAIINANITVTNTTTLGFTIATITFNNPAATGANILNINDTTTLTTTGDVVFNANTGTLNQTIQLHGSGILNVGGNLNMGNVPTSSGSALVTTSVATACTSCKLQVTGTTTLVNATTAVAGASKITMTTGATNLFSTAALTITANATGTGIATVSTATGTITTTGATTFTTSGAQAKTLLNVTAAGILNLGGDLGANGTVTLVASSTTKMTATAAINGAYTFGIFNVNAGTTTTGAGTITSAGAMAVASGAVFTMGNFAFTASSTVSVTGTINTATGLTGTRTFGALTVDSGGTFDLSGQNPPATFTGTITNNSANQLKAGSGALTLAAAQSLAGNGSGGMLFNQNPYTVPSGTTITNNMTVGTVTFTALTIANPTVANGLSLTTASITTVTGTLTYTANTSTAIAQTITMNGTANLNANALTFGTPTGTGNGLVTCAASATGTFTVTTTIGMTGNSTSTGKVSLGMLTCTLSASGLVTLTGGTNATGVAEITSSTGVITTAAGVTFAGTAGNAKITTSGAATWNNTGTISGGGATSLSLTASTLTKFTGTSAVNTAYTSWKNWEVVSGTTTLGAVQTVTGAQVDNGAVLAGSTFLLTNTCTGTGTAGFRVDGTYSGSGGVTINTATCTIDAQGAGAKLVSNTGTFTISAAATIASTASITIQGKVSISGNTTVTNNGTVVLNTSADSLNGSLAGSTWSNAGSSILRLTGTIWATAGTLTANAGTNTVDYNGTTQTCKATTYVNLQLDGTTSTDTCAPTDVTGTLTVGGGISWTATAITMTGALTLNTTGTVTGPASGTWSIGGALTVTAGTLTLVGHTFTVTGVASITGTINTATSATGTKTFNNTVTVNSGGTFDLSAINPAITFANTITNNSANQFKAGSGALTLAAAQSLAGNGSGGMLFNQNPYTVPSGTTITNNMTVGTVTFTALTIANPTVANGLSLTTASITTVTNALTFNANTSGTVKSSIVMNGTANLNAGSLVMTAPTGAGNTNKAEQITCNAGSGTFTVTGTTAITGNSTSTGDAELDMQSCTFTANGLVTLTGGTNATGVALLKASTGILNINAGLTEAAGGTITNAQVTTSGAATMNFVGTWTGAGTLTLNSATVTKFTGGATALNAAFGSGTWAQWEVVSGTTTLGATQTILGVQVDNGAILAGSTFLLTNACTGTGTAGFRIDGTFSGSGGVTINTATCTIDAQGAGAKLVSNTGTFTISANATIASTANISIGAAAATNPLTVTAGTTTNNGTVTIISNGVGAGLTGAGTWVNAANSTLNTAGGTTTAISITTLTATANPNTVNYNGDVAQTIKATTYYNLTLSPTITAGRIYSLAATTVNNNFTINPSAASAQTLTASMSAAIAVTGTTLIQGSGAGPATGLLDAVGANNLTTGLLSIQTNGTYLGQSSAITINTATASSTLFTLAASGATFTAGTSTVKMQSDADETLTSGTFTGGNKFNNLELSPAPTAARAYTFGAGAIVAGGTFLIAPITNAFLLTVNLGAGGTTITGLTTIQGTTATSNLATGNNALTSGTLSIQSGGTFTPGSTGVILNTSTASSTLFTLGGSGVFTAGTSTIKMQSNADETLTSGTFTGGNAFNNLELSPPMTLARAYTFGAGEVTVGGAFDIKPTTTAVALTVNLGAGGLTVTGATTIQPTTATANLTTTSSNNPFTTGSVSIQSGGTFTGNATATVTVNGAVTIASGGTLTSTSGTLAISTDFSNSGTFNHSSGLVSFTSNNATLFTGSTTFNNLTITDTVAKTVTFTASSTTTVSGTWTVTGASGQLVTLTRSAPTVWNVNPTSTSIDYVDVSYSTNQAAESICASHSQSTNGNNTNWTVTAGICTQISGVVYNADESTIGTSGNGGPCDGSTAVISIRVNGGTANTATCSSSTAAYSIPGIPSSSGDTVTVYLTSATKANTVTLSSGAAMSGVDLYLTTVNVRHENAGPMTATVMAQYDNTADATNMLFDAVTGSPNTLTVNSNTELHVAASKTFTPSGRVTTQGTGILHIAGTATIDTSAGTIAGGITIPSGGTLNINADTTVGGTISVTNTGAITTTSGTPTVTMSATSSITGTGNTTFYNLQTSGTAVLTYNASGTNTINNNLTAAAGTTVNLNSNISITNGLINATSGVIGTSAGTPTVTMTGATPSVGGGTTGAITIYNLTTSGTGTTTLTNGGTNTINNNVSVGAGTTLNINSSVSIAGNLTNTTTGIISTSAGTPTVTVSGATVGSGSGAITMYRLDKAGGGTTTFSGSGTNTISNNLNVTAGTFTLSNTLTVTGSAAVSASSTFNINANLNINGGNLTTATSAIINTTAGTPTVTMSGTGNVGGGTTGAITIYNLTTTGSGTTSFTNGGANTINNNVSVGAGTTLNINSSISLAGNLANATSGIIGTTAGTPTVTMTGATPSVGGGTTGAITIYNLTTSGTGTTTFTNGGANTINNNVSVGAGTTLNINSSVSIGGSLTNTATGIINTTAGTPTITLTGATPTIGSGSGDITFYALTTSGTGTFTFSGAGTNTVNNNVSVGAGTTLNINSSVSIAGSLTNATSGVIGTTSGTPTITMTGATPSIGGGTTGDITIYNLTTSGTGTTTFTNGGANTINNNVSVGAGTTLKLNSSVTITGTVTNTTTGIITTDAGTPTVTINGTASMCGGNSGNCTFYNLAFGGASTTIGSDMTIKNNLTLPATVTAGSTTVTMTGSGTLVGGGATLNNLTINGVNTTVTVATSGLTVSGILQLGGAADSDNDTFTIGSGLTVTLSGNSGTTLDIKNSGTDSINGPGRLTYQNSVTDFPTVGTLGPTLITRFDLVNVSNNGAMVIPQRTYGAVEAYNGTANTVTLKTNSNSTYTLGGGLNINTNSTGPLIFDATGAGSFNSPMTIGGDITFTKASTGTVTITSGTGTWTGSGNVNFTNGTYTATAGNTLVMSGTGTLTSNANTLQNVTLSGTITLAGATHTISGNLDLTSSTLTTTGSTIKMNGTSTTITGAGKTINNFEVSGGSVTQSGALIVAGIFLLSGGTFTQAANSDLTVNGASFTLNSSTTFTKASGSGKLILDKATGLTFTDSNATKQNLGAVQIGSSSGITTLATDMSADSVTIPTGDTFNTKGYDVTLTDFLDAQSGSTLDLTDTAPSNEGDGTIFDVGGNVTTNAGSTFTSYTNSKLFMNSTAGTNTNRTWTTGGKAYNDVELKNAGATNDQVILSGNLDVNGVFTLTDGTIKADTNNPTINTADNVTIASAAAYTKGSGAWTFDGTTAKTYTDNTATPQNIGVVAITKTNGTPANNKITLASSMTADTMTISASNTLDLANSGYILKLANVGATGTVLTVSGTLTPNSNSTVQFSATNSGGTVVVPATTYNSIQLSGNETYDLGGNLTSGNAMTGGVTIDTGGATLDTVSGSNFNLSLGGAWTNNGTFTQRTGTVTMTGTANLTGSTATTFNNLTIDGTNITVTVATSDPTVSGTLTIGGDANANTDVLSVGAGRTVNATGTTTLTDASDTISGAGTLRFTDTSSGPGTTGTLSSVVRFDATAANVPTTTLDARTYGGAVELYGNVAAVRSITFPTGTFTFSSSLTVITGASQSSVLTADASNGGASNPTVNITGNVSYSKGGSATPAITTGTGTWTVGGNADFSNGTFTATAASTLIMNGTGTLTSNGNTLQNVTLSGTVTLASATHTISGNLSFAGGTITPGTSTILMNGTGGKTLTGGNASIYALTIDPTSAGTITLQTSDLTVANQLTVATGDTLSLSSGRTLTNSFSTNVALSGTISGTGTLRFINGSGGPGTTGTLGSTVRFDASAGDIASTTVDARPYRGRLEFYSNSASNRIITYPSGSFTCAFSLGFYIYADGAGNTTVDMSANNPASVSVCGDIDFVGSGGGTEILSAGTGNLIESGTGTSVVDFTGGTFTSTGTLTLSHATGVTLTAAGNSLKNLTAGPNAVITLVNETVTITGNLDISLAAGFTPASSTVVMTGTANSITAGSFVFNNLTIDPASTGTITGIDSFNVDGVLTVASGDTLSLNAASVVNSDLSGSTLSLSGTISGAGQYWYEGSATFPTTGTLSAETWFVGDQTPVITLAGRTFGGTVVFDHAVDSITRTLKLGSGAGQTFTFSGDLQIRNDSFVSATSTIDGATNNPTVNITGNIVKQASDPGTGTLTMSSGTGTWTVSGNVNLAGMTFTATSGNTLAMNGTGTLTSNSNTLQNFTTSGGGTITLANATHTIAGNLNIGSTGLTAGTSVVVMTGTSKTIDGGGKSLNSLTISGSETLQNTDLTIGAALQVDTAKSLTINASRTVTLSGNSGTTLTLNGTINGPGSLTYQNSVTTFPTSGTLASTLITRFDTVNNNMIVPARTDYGTIEAFGGSANARSVTLGTAGAQTITASGNFYVIANAVSPNDVTVTATTNNPALNISGDLDFTGTGTASEVIQSGTGNWAVSGNVDFTGGTYTATSGNTLEMNGSSKTLTANSQSLHHFKVSAGTVSVADANVTLNGDMILSGGTLTAPSGNLSVGGSWNKTSGTFTHNAGTVKLTGTSTATVSGSTTFNNLSVTSIGAAKQITFTAGTTTTVSGTWTITGASGQLVTLTSSTTSVWNVNPTSAAIDYVDVSYSNNQGASICATHSQSTNGNNTGWSVSAGPTCGVTISGRIYTDDGSTALSCASSRTIAVKVNGVGSYSAGCSNSPSTGSYSIPAVTIGGAGDVVSIFISGATEKAVTVTLATNTSSDITGADLYQDRLIVRHESAGPMTNSATVGLGKYDKDDDATNFFYTSNSNNLSLDAGKKLLLWTGKSYTPGGTVTTAAASTAGNPDGDLTIQSSATMTMGTNALAVGGDLVNSGTLSVSSGQTTTMTATGSGFSFNTNGATMDSVNFSGSGGTWTNNDSTTLNNLLTTGTNATLSIASAKTVTLAGTSGTTLTNNGTVSGAGTLIYQNNNNTLTTAGTLSSLFRFDLVNGNETIPNRTFGGNVVALNGTTSARTLLFGASVTPTFSGNFDLQQSNASGTLLLDGATNNPATVTVTGNFTNSLATGNVTVSMGSGNWSEAGNFDLTNLFALNNNSGTLTMTGTTKTITSNGKSLYNVTINSGGSNNVTMSGATTVSNNLLITTGTLTAPAAANLTVGGDFTNNSTFTHNSGTAILTGASNNLAGSATTTFNNLTISGTTITVPTGGSDVTVNGTLNVNDSKTLSIASARTVTAPGVININSTGTISGAGRLTLTSATTGIPTGTTGTLSSIVRFDATAANVPATAIIARTYGGDLEMYSNVAAVRTWTPAAGTYNVSGNFKIMTGASQSSIPTYAANTSNVTMNITGDLSYTIGGSATPKITSGTSTWTVSGNVNTTNGGWTATSGNTLVMNGAAKTLTSDQNFYNLTISANAVAVSTLSPNVTHTLTVSGSSQLTINTTVSTLSAATVVLTGTIAGSGTLNYQGSAAFPSTGTISSVLTYQPAGSSVTITTRTYGGDVNCVDSSTNPTTCTLASGSPVFNGNLTVQDLGDGTTLTGATNNPTVTIAGSFSASNTLTVTVSMGSNPWTVGGNFDLTNVTTFNNNSGTLTMNGTGTLTTAGQTLNNFTTSGGGTITFANATHTLAGNLNIGSTGLTAGTSTVVMTGSSKTIDGGGKTLNNLTISGTTTLQNTALTVAGTLAVNSTLSGDQNLTVNGAVNGSGTITLSAGTFDQRVAAAQNFGSTSNANNWTFNNLTFSNSSGTNRTITAASGGSGQIIVNGVLTVGQGGDSNSTTFDDETNDRIIDANGAVSITAKGSLTASSTASFTVAGNWTLTSGGVFTAGSGTVTLDGGSQQTVSTGMTSTNQFNNLTITNASGSDPDSSPSVIFNGDTSANGTVTDVTASSKLRFNANSTYTFTAINLNGQASGTPVYLHSSSGGTQWHIVAGAGSRTVSNTAIKDSEACSSNGGSIDATDGTNVDEGNLLCWLIGKLSVVLSATTLNLGTLSSASISYQGITSTVTTNAANGYVSVVSYSGAFSNGTDTIADAGGTLTQGASAFGAASSKASQTLATDNSSPACTTTQQTSTGTFNATALSTTPKQFASAAGIVSNDTTTLCFLGAISGAQAPGAYSTTVTVVTTARF